MTALRQPSETEVKLLDAALTLFAERGYAATSVREIIEATGFARPVLYYYCQNKEDLFRRVVQSVLEPAHHELGRLLESDLPVEAKLRALMRGTFALCSADPRVAKLLFQVSAGPYLPMVSEWVRQISAERFQAVARMMKAGQAEGLLAQADADGLALAFCSLMDHPVNAFSQMPDGAQYLSQALADGLVDLFLHGAVRRDTSAFIR